MIYSDVVACTEDGGIGRKDSEHASSERLGGEAGHRIIEGKEVTIVTNDIEIAEDRSVQGGEVSLAPRCNYESRNVSAVAI